MTNNGNHFHLKQILLLGSIFALFASHDKWDGEIYTSGGTALFDAVVATSNYIHQKGKSRRRALLFITDGMEKNSSVKEDEVITSLIENQAQAYFICLPGQDTPPYSRKMTPLKARELMDRPDNKIEALEVGH